MSTLFISFIQLLTHLSIKDLEVFTVPPHSSGIHMKFVSIPYGFHMEWIWLKFHSFFHIHSIWNSYGILKFHMNIPLESRWNGMEWNPSHSMESLYSTWNVMDHIPWNPYDSILFHLDSSGILIWNHCIPPNSRWNEMDSIVFHMKSFYSILIIPYGFHPIPHRYVSII